MARSDGPSALETRLASFFGVEAATAHGPGFTNALVISVLAGPGSLVLIDQAVQGPLSYSARVNGGTVRHFSHNDPEHLRQLLREAIAHGQPGSGRPWAKVWVVLEGLYDNSGRGGGEYDRCCLSDIVRVCKRYSAYVLLEETRSLAARGRGTCAVEGVDPSGVTLVTCECLALHVLMRHMYHQPARGWPAYCHRVPGRCVLCDAARQCVPYQSFGHERTVRWAHTHLAPWVSAAGARSIAHLKPAKHKAGASHLCALRVWVKVG